MLDKVVRERPEGLPANVTRAAADARLGAYEVTWKPQFALKMIFGAFLAICTAGMAVGLIRNPDEAGLLPAGATVMTAVLALRYLDPLRLRMRVFGFAGGLVFRNRKGDLGAVGWDRITSARRARKPYAQRGNYHVFTVQLPDGQFWSVDDRNYPRECLDSISRRVERELTTRRLPDALARIADGGQVECGGAVVDSTGVTSTTLTVGWAEVRRVVDDFGAVRVLTPRGWRELYGGREHSTPDVDLLVALARRLARG